ncbi:flavin reductase family protein [Chloroflexota bacterium]
MKFDPMSLKHRDLAHLLTDVVVPRPIAWVSTVSEQGIYNIAPFSAYSMVGIRPLLLCFSVGTTREGQKKDTILNIELTKEFVISIVTEEVAEAMNKTSAPYPSDVSEYEEVGLTSLKADLVKAPMVGESPINMECRAIQILEFGQAPTLTNLVIGEILLIHVADEYYDKPSGRITGLKAVGRLGGDGDIYCRIRDSFQMKRPTL